MKVIVAGSRDFNNYNLLKIMLDNLLKGEKNPVIVCGEARGADKLGKRYAYEHNLSVESYPADWSLGKAAGYLRNEIMGKHSDKLIAFWDGHSKGTKHMIDVMEKLNKPVTVIRYTGE